MKRKRSYKLKMNTASVGVKAAIAYFLANVVNKGIAYLTTPLFTNLLTSDEYGQVSVFLSWTSLLGVVAMFSFQAGVFNNGMLEYNEDRDCFAYSLLKLSNLITLVISAFIFITYDLLRDFLKLDILLLILMTIIFLTQPAYNFWITRQRFEYKYKVSTFIMIIMNVLSPVVALLCICFAGSGGNHVYARLFGAEGVLILFYVVFYIYTAVKARFKIKIEYWKFAFVFNLPLIPHYLSQYMMNSSDKIMISFLIGDSQTAYYNVAYSVAAVVSIVWTSINASLVPYTYQKCKEKKYNDIAKIVTPLWVIYAVICLTMMVFAPELIALMAPAEYGLGKYVIPPVIGGVFFQSMYYSFANINYYYKKTKYVMYASLSAAVLNILLNYLLIPQYGFIVAGYTTLFSYVVQAGIDYYAMRKVVSENIFSVRVILILASAVIFTACLFPILYEETFWRYFTLVLIVLVSIPFRNRIINVIKQTLLIMKKEK